MFKFGTATIIILLLAGFAAFAQVCEIGATEVQYLMQNTDTIKGNFTLNFIFNNREDTKTNTRKITIAAGAQEAVTEISPLNGESSVQLNVIPPTKQVPYDVPVKKKVTILKKILDLIEMYNE